MHSVLPASSPCLNAVETATHKAVVRAESGLAAALRDYSQLFKARVTAMILLTAWCAAYVASSTYAGSALSWNVVIALLAITLVAAGTAAMNEVIERDTDAKMLRTANRPLVTGRISVRYACVIAAMMILGGSAYLALATNWLTACLTLLTSLLYLAAYTPLKKITPLCTSIGAVPGAMPALLGWTAVRGRLDIEAFALFAIVFLWQFPHFHSIALMYRDDYARGGIRMLPVVNADCTSTVNTILVTSFVLVPIAFLPEFFVQHATLYSTLAFALGAGMFGFAWALWRDHILGNDKRTRRRARQLLLATIIYIPALFAALILSLRP